MNRQASSGGAATASGMDFQHRVAAWVAVQVLAEKAATLPWDLPSATALERIECETKQPVDDLLIVTSDNGFVFCQIKHRLTLSSRASSDFASALNQFVCQFIYSRNMTGRRSTIRPLDPAKDRLVLITSLVSSKLIRVLLPNLLKKLRNLSPGQTLNDQERRALSIVRKHISRSWRKTLKAKPSKEELHQLLSLIHIHVMDVEAEGRDERDAKNLLRMAVLRKPEEADKAWNTLVTLCAGYTSQRSGAGRAILQRELLKVGCDLKAPRSYEEDIEKLRNRSFQTLAALAHLAEIRVGSRIVKVRRACTQALCQAAEDGSILVIGEPGVGKSGVLHDFVEELSDNNRDYIFLAIDRLAAKSLGELREELGLEHELSEIIENWPGLQPAFLVIDTLDAARWDSVGKMIRDLIRQAIEKKERWRVVVSIRKFDLRYGTEIQQLFAGTPPTEFADPEFKGVRHLNVPRFSQEELAQIGAESPSLQEIITNATSELHELLLLPFNLRLMAELIGEGIASGQLTPIKTQIGLLDKYWEHRVLRNDGYDDGREAILREMIERMVEYRTLRADRSAVARPDTSELLKDLLSTQVLIEWQASPEAKPDRYSLAFSHHVIFDYAVARLLFRGTDDKVIRRLSGDPELVIVVRPSLFFHFYYIWESNANADRSVFWDLTFRLIDNPRIPRSWEDHWPCRTC
jgi:DNA replication protein DnaC